MTDTVVATSHQAIKRGSKSFAAAARLFDRSVRDDCALLYAFCRYCDDRIDGQDLGYRQETLTPAQRAERLAGLYAKTEEALLRGKADDKVFEALQLVVGRHGIDPNYPLTLLRGFAMDVDGRTYETLEDVLDYAYHVAGVVGVMMAQIMGVRDEATLDRASDLGIAFQLTNIARDVIPDSQMGRIYLPRRWLEEAGVSSILLSDSIDRDRLFAVTLRLLEAAEPYYDSAAIGERSLPPRCAWAIGAARRIYRSIGDNIRQAGPTALYSRVRTSRLEKLAAILRAAADLRRSSPHELSSARPPDLFLRPQRLAPATAGGS